MAANVRRENTDAKIDLQHREHPYCNMDVLEEVAENYALLTHKDEKDQIKSRITMLLMQMMQFANNIETTLLDTSTYDAMLEQYLNTDSGDMCPLLSELEDLAFSMKTAMKKRDEYLNIRTVRIDPTLRSRPSRNCVPRGRSPSPDSLEGQMPSITDVTEEFDIVPNMPEEEDETEAIMRAIEEQEMRDALAASEGPVDPNRISHV
jgi:hypothetical protein